MDMFVMVVPTVVCRSSHTSTCRPHQHSGFGCTFNWSKRAVPRRDLVETKLETKWLLDAETHDASLGPTSCYQNSNLNPPFGPTVVHYRLFWVTLTETNSNHPLKIGRERPKRKRESMPTIHFQGPTNNWATPETNQLGCAQLGGSSSWTYNVDSIDAERLMEAACASRGWIRWTFWISKNWVLDWCSWISWKIPYGNRYKMIKF